MGEEKPQKRKGEGIIDNLYRNLVAREDARQQGQDKDRDITVRMPESGDKDIVAYGQPGMLDEFEKRMKKEGGPSYEGVEVGSLPKDDPERMEKIRRVFGREIEEANSVRKELEAKYGMKFLEGKSESEESKSGEEG